MFHTGVATQITKRRMPAAQMPKLWNMMVQITMTMRKFTPSDWTTLATSSSFRLVGCLFKNKFKFIKDMDFIIQ